MVRNRDHVRAHEHEVQSLWVATRIALEEREELAAAFVDVDASDVHRERPPDAEFLAEARRFRPGWNLGADADDHPWKRAAADAFNQRPFLERVVHDGPHAAKHRRENREADRRVALRG